DVLEIVAVAVIADGPEALLHHDLGEAEDGVQRRPDLMADLGEKVGLRGARRQGCVASRRKAALRLAFSAQVPNQSAIGKGLRRADPREDQRESQRSSVP